MNKTLKPLALMIALATSSSSFAEDFIPQQSSPGLEAMNQVAETPFKQEALIEEEYVPASDQIQEYMLSKGWQEGWDSKKKRMFIVYSETFNSENPSYDDSFVTIRSQYALIASLGAKAGIVEFMRTEMSAVDQISAPGTDVHAELNERYNKATKKIAAQQKKLVKLAAEVDKSYADQADGASWNDIGKRYWEGLITKLDNSYAAGDIDKANRKKYEKAKKYYNEAAVEMETIEAEAAKIQGAVSLEASSMVETLAKAPVMGASILLQAESWNAEEDEYEVAMLMVWSPKLEAAAKSIVTGENNPLKPKKGKSVHDWLKAQDLSTLIGPRTYVDKFGERWFIGAYAMPYDGSASLKRKNKGFAELFAKKEAVMALYADIETQKTAEIAMQTRSGGLNGKDNTQVATSFAESTKQSIEGREVKGNAKLLSKTIVHPLSQQKIYVTVYGISGSSASEALKMERSAFESAGAVNSANTQSKNDRASLEKDLEASHNTTTASGSSTIVQGSEQESSMSKEKSQSSTLFNAPEIDEDDF